MTKVVLYDGFNTLRVENKKAYELFELSQAPTPLPFEAYVEI